MDTKVSVDRNVKMSKKNKISRTRSWVEEDPVQMQRHLKNLRDLLLEDNDLFAPNDDAFLLRFLRSMKFDCLGTFKLIQKYYQVRIDYAEIFLIVCPSEIMVADFSKILTVLPKRDQYGRRLVILKSGNWDPSQFSVTEMLRMTLFLLETVIKDEETQKNGIVVISDCKGFSWKQARYAPAASKTMLQLFMDSFPIRYENFHVVNESRIIYFVYRIFQPFLNEEVQKRVFFHGNDWRSLHKHIDSSALPVEYGGTCTSEDRDHFFNEILDSEEYFIENNKYGYISKEIE